MGLQPSGLGDRSPPVGPGAKLGRGSGDFIPKPPTEVDPLLEHFADIFKQIVTTETVKI